MKRFLQISIYATYPFLALSLLFLLGMPMGMAFVTGFTVENRTGEIVSITPVGTLDEEGKRGPLPVKLYAGVPLPAWNSGARRLADGESITIYYDWDDINFSEILVENAQGQQRQFIIDPNPTSDQFHMPSKSHFVIDDFPNLQVASPAVQTAANAANKRTRPVAILYLLIFGPWIVYGILRWIRRSSERRL
jgi:hypothetical protein